MRDRPIYRVLWCNFIILLCVVSEQRGWKTKENISFFSYSPWQNYSLQQSHTGREEKHLVFFDISKCKISYDDVQNEQRLVQSNQDCRKYCSGVAMILHSSAPHPRRGLGLYKSVACEARRPADRQRCQISAELQAESVKLQRTQHSSPPGITAQSFSRYSLSGLGSGRNNLNS